jgi:aminoglycoside phosphotransferase (APT) family kinase protein
MTTSERPDDVVSTWEEAAGQEREPLIVLEPLREYLRDRGLAAEDLDAHPIGTGHSNETYLLSSGAERVVLRRPPRGPLLPRTHDVLREARLIEALRPTGFPAPEVLAICPGREVIGAPFYLMSYVEGVTLDDEIPPAYGEEAPEVIASELMLVLGQLHAIDAAAGEIADLGRPDGYLGRQFSLFSDLLDKTRNRPLPALDRVTAWLGARLPEQHGSTVVHGDYRLGNTMFEASRPRLAAVLDWEMATLGDPLVDVGYCSAMWSVSTDPDTPMSELTPLTRRPEFPGRDFLRDSYGATVGRPIGDLRWYEVFAVWKLAIILEGSYRRYLSGSTDDEYFGRLEAGIPALADLALEWAGRAGDR